MRFFTVGQVITPSRGNVFPWFCIEVVIVCLKLYRVGLTSPREAERWLVIMIEEGSIHATISQKDGKIFRALNQACSEVYFEADYLILDIRHYSSMHITLFTKVLNLASRSCIYFRMSY